MQPGAHRPRGAAGAGRVRQRPDARPAMRTPRRALTRLSSSGGYPPMDAEGLDDRRLLLEVAHREAGKCNLARTGRINRHSQSRRNEAEDRRTLVRFDGNLGREADAAEERFHHGQEDLPTVAIAHDEGLIRQVCDRDAFLPGQAMIATEHGDKRLTRQQKRLHLVMESMADGAKEEEYAAGFRLRITQGDDRHGAAAARCPGYRK